MTRHRLTRDELDDVLAYRRRLIAEIAIASASGGSGPSQVMLFAEMLAGLDRLLCRGGRT